MTQNAAMALRRLVALLLWPVAAFAQAQSPPAALNNRHALIVAIGEYSDASVPPLRGMRHDVASARRIAAALAVPAANTHVLRDFDASAARIRNEMAALAGRVAAGDRVFVYFSAHGTRALDDAASTVSAPVCTEGLLASDGRSLSHADIAQALAPLAAKADKLIVFHDTCYSGGIAAEPLRTRSLQRPAASAMEGAEVITPKFTRFGTHSACAQPSNLRTRSLAAELQLRRAWPDNVVHVAASRIDEVSFDSSFVGGYATVAWRDCLLGEAVDADGSGAVTVAEVTACAQARLDGMLAGLPGVTGQRLTLAGNTALALSPARVPVSMPPAAPLVAAPAPEPVPPAQVLAEVHAQRDAARAVQLRLQSAPLVVGRDALAFEVLSPRDGHLYLALASADGLGLTLLFPNGLARDNRIRAGVPLRLPGPQWGIVAAPPAGRETLLALVTDSPRDLEALLAEPGSAGGPFIRSLLDTKGRAVLQQVLVGQEAFGAALVQVQTTTAPLR